MEVWGCVRMQDSQAHLALTENESKKLCKYIDCQKLSQEISNHVAHNDRLPVQVAVVTVYVGEEMEYRFRVAILEASDQDARCQYKATFH
ncbi:hypothetical protein C5167_021511 [Papaver somniferum]|nr:hypothetical protein C5167_021511 [Papaver somniferum]